METYTVTIYDNKTIAWRNSDGKLHREDGPAVEYANGNKAWYLNGKLHREDGPAIERADGTKEWWLDDKRHREDGPAIEWADGDKSWYVNGKKLTQEQFLARTKCKPKQASCAGKVVEVDGKKYKLVEV
jgi:hypothetical protein